MNTPQDFEPPAVPGDTFGPHPPGAPFGDLPRENPWRELLRDCAEDAEHPPPMRAELIEGIARNATKVMLAAPSKAGKTFCLMQLGLAVANGGEWMGVRCRRGRVLFVNFELHADTFAHRLHAICRKLGPRYGGADVVALHLRGKLDCDAVETCRRIGELAEEIGAAAVIIDPIYRVGAEFDENSNSEIAQLTQILERMTNTGATLIFAHHFSKGAQGGKKAVDRPSGAGAWARDPDAIITLTEVEGDDPDLYLCQMSLREMPPFRKFGVRWEYPLHRVVPISDDTRAAGAPGRKPVHSVEKAVEILAAAGAPLTSVEWQRHCAAQQIGATTFYALKAQAELCGAVRKEGRTFTAATNGPEIQPDNSGA